MLNPQYQFIAGIFVGIIITLLLVGKGPKVVWHLFSELVFEWSEVKTKKIEKVISNILRMIWILYIAAVIIYFAYHLKRYWITLDPHHQTLDGLKQALLAAPGIVGLITIGAYASLAGILTFIVRIPFMNWEQIKIFGFEYKRQLKEVTNEAKNTFDEMLNEQQVRYSTVQSLLEDEFYDDLMQTSVYANLQYTALKKTVDLIQDIYSKTPLDVHVESGVVIINSQKQIQNLSTVPTNIQPYIQRCLVEDTIQRVDRKGFSLRVMPIRFSDQTDPYYMIYLESAEFQFDEFDEKLLEIAYLILELQLSYMFYDRQHATG